MNNWPRKTVLQLQDEGILRVEDGNHGEYRPRRDEFAATGTCFIRAADMNAGRIDFENSSRINDAAVSRIRKGVGEPNDILFSHKGTVGKLAVAPPDAPQFVCSPQTTFYRVFDAETLDRSFLFAFMQSPAFKSQWHSVKGETDMADYVSLTAQRRLLITLPPITDQRAIGSILGALDYKIDLNRRMNETLEAMARALFKSWFVDFDPVRAKMDGREPFGMDPATAALFPDRLVESEIGLIPEGWKVTTLGDAVELNPRYTLTKGEPATFVEMKSVPTAGHRPTDWRTRDFTSGSKFQNGDTLLARITPCLENGKTAFVDFLEADEIGWGSTEFIVIRPKSPMPCFWGYCLARDDDFRSFAIQTMTGSSGRQRVQVDALADYEVVIPDQKTAMAFSDATDVIAETIRSNDLQSRTLAELRDLLLPKLLSGEIRVADAEKEVEGVL